MPQALSTLAISLHVSPAEIVMGVLFFLSTFLIFLCERHTLYNMLLGSVIGYILYLLVISSGTAVFGYIEWTGAKSLLLGYTKQITYICYYCIYIYALVMAWSDRLTIEIGAAENKALAVLENMFLSLLISLLAWSSILASASRHAPFSLETPFVSLSTYSFWRDWLIPATLYRWIETYSASIWLIAVCFLLYQLVFHRPIKYLCQYCLKLMIQLLELIRSKFHNPAK